MFLWGKTHPNAQCNISSFWIEKLSYFLFFQFSFFFYCLLIPLLRAPSKDAQIQINLNIWNSNRSSHLRRSVRNCVLRNFAIFTGKHLCQTLFLIKLQASAYNFIKKQTLAQVFSCECSEISKNTFFTEHVWATAYRVNFV